MKKLFRLSAVAAIAALTIAVTSCGPANTYDKNGISFGYPSGWSIVADDFADGRGYIELAKDGASPKANIIFGYLVSDARIGADMMLEGIFQEMQLAPGFTDLIAADPADVTYGPYPARAVTYTATVDGVAKSGAVWVFTANGRVVNVAISEGANRSHEGAFKTIRESFELK